MSDPTTNREIEDVLSSIRRLVSQERAHEKHPASAEAPDEGALVLTPALRVIEGDSRRPDLGAILVDPEEGIGFGSGRIRGDTVLAALGAVGQIGPSGAAEDALEEARAWSDRPATDQAVDPDEAAQDRSDDAWQDDAPDTTLEATIAELEAAVAGIDAEFEPDGGEDSVEADDANDAGWFGAGTATVPEDRMAAALADAGGDAAGPTAVATDADQSADLVEDGTGNLDDAAVGPDATGPEAAGSPAGFGSGMRRLHLAPDETATASGAGRLEDDLGRAGIAEPYPAEEPPEPPRSRIFVRRPDPAADAAPPGPPPAGPGAATVAPAATNRSAVDRDAGAAAAIASTPAEGPARDEAEAEEALAGLDLALLQRLVSDMLRQELRGPLGERITQNVRKLVRREVMRALEAREFE